MASNLLTSLETVKRYLRINVADTTSDALLEILISAASSFIQGILNRTFAASDYVQRSNGNGVYFMIAADYPLLAVTGVTVDGRAIPPAPGETSAGFLFDKDGVYLRGYQFSKGVQNVVLTYRAGYEDIPAVVDDVAATLVAKKFKYLDRIGHVSKILSGETVTFEKSDLTDELKSILRNFAKVVPV